MGNKATWNLNASIQIKEKEKVETIQITEKTFIKKWDSKVIKQVKSPTTESPKKSGSKKKPIQKTPSLDNKIRKLFTEIAKLNKQIQEEEDRKCSNYWKEEFTK